MACLHRLKEVQEFPEDFDGVVRLHIAVGSPRESALTLAQVVGAPANYWTHIQAWHLHQNLKVQPSTSPRFITEDIWLNVIAPEVMRQCDALDGVREPDGILEARADAVVTPFVTAQGWYHQRSASMPVRVHGCSLTAVNDHEW